MTAYVAHEMRLTESDATPQLVSRKVKGRSGIVDTYKLLRDRVRKIFAGQNVHLLSGESAVSGSSIHRAPKVFKLKWNVTEDDVKVILGYWKHESALNSSGVSALVNDIALPSAVGRTRLQLIIWQFSEQLQQHVDTHPPVRTPYGSVAPPFVVERQHLLPVTEKEASLIRHKASFRKLCIRQLELASYADDLAALKAHSSDVKV